jgi:hypothetical protein
VSTKFVQIKALGSKLAPPRGSLIFLICDIRVPDNVRIGVFYASKSTKYAPYCKFLAFIYACYKLNTQRMKNRSVFCVYFHFRNSRFGFRLTVDCVSFASLIPEKITPTIFHSVNQSNYVFIA